MASRSWSTWKTHCKVERVMAASGHPEMVCSVVRAFNPTKILEGADVSLLEDARAGERICLVKPLPSEEIPSFVCSLLVADAPDHVLTHFAADIGLHVKCDTPSDSVLTKWLEKHPMVSDKSTLRAIVRRTDGDINAIMSGLRTAEAVRYVVRRTAVGILFRSSARSLPGALL